MDLVSICMPCYNRSKYVVGAIRSCLDQSYKNIEIIVVDDRSKDDTLGILRRYARKYPNIKVLANKKNCGPAVSFNKAFRAASGEFIVMNGSDDYLTPDSIESRVRRFTPELDLLYGSVKVFYGSKSIKWCANHKMKYQKRAIAAHAVMMRRRVFEKYGLFYEKLRLNEDAEYWYRLGMMKRGGVRRTTDLKYMKVPVICAYVRIHKGSTVAQMKVNRKLKQKKLFRERIRRINKEGVTKKNTVF